MARCIESVRAQTYQNIEIILINDGSCDNVSRPLIEMYAQVDTRIRLQHKPNGGVSNTRNLGVDMARGKYVQFVDCDDYLTPSATQLLVEKAERCDSDLVIAAYTMVEFQKTEVKEDVYSFLPEGSLNQRQFALHLLERPSSFYFDVLWNKLYRRDLICGNGLCFDEQMVWSEDAVFNFQYFQCCKQIYAMETPVYYYVQNPDSICHTLKNPFTMLKARRSALGAYITLYKTMGLYRENRRKIYRFAIETTENTAISRLKQACVLRR